MLFVPPSMSSMVPDAFAQTTPLTLILDPLPSTVQEGDPITFSGILLTADQQYYIPNETIYIKDDISFGSDIVIGTVTTSNEDGTFSATWTATPRSDGGAYDFFAVFEGTSSYGYARSQEYSVTVTQATTPTAPTGPTPLKLVLDPLPSTVQEGDPITFSGILLTADEQYYIPNETIYIKDDISVGADIIIGTVTSSSQNGRFSATWTAVPRSDGGAYDFFAVFEGTSSYGYARSQEYSVTVIETATTAPQFYGTKIILDPLPTNVNKGDPITFSGILLTADEQYYVPNETIYIKDDVTIGADTVIGTLTTNENGRFSGTWTATPRSDGGAYDFFAVFEGTSDLGYSRSQEYAVSVIGPTESTPPTIGGMYYTELVLNQIPAAVYSTQSVTFSGQLTSNGQPVANALIYIKEDDPLLPDQFIANGKTNSNGMFSITWRVTAGLVEVDFDIYAVFEGDDLHIRAVTTTQQMKVEKYWSAVSLHPFPQSVNIGDMVIFSGTVKLEKGSPEGFVVYIKDEDPFADDLMATAYVNRDGSFTANWSVTYVDADAIADVYAVLEATELYYRSTTCDPSGITFDFGGSCENTIPIQITGVTQPTPKPTPEREIPDEKFDGDEYIEYFFTSDFKKNPLVAIVPQPDSYDKVRSSLIPAQEGVLIWASMLEKRNNGNWDVDFEIVAPGNTFSQKPDVIMNVVWYDKQYGACGEIRGYAQLSPGIYKTGQPINTVVCASIFDVKTSNAEVSNIAAHEFVHAIGLGHAFNKPGDLMCSVEPKRPTGFAGGPTCGNNISISELGRFLVVRSPSDMDIATVEHMYNKDGFKTPNQNVELCGGSCIPRFTVEDYQGYNESGFEQEEKPKNIVIPSWVKTYAGWWADGRISDKDYVNGIEYLIKEGIIQIGSTQSGVGSSQQIPSWVKNNAKWWAEGLISDEDYVQGIEYLIKEGIIRV